MLQNYLVIFLRKTMRRKAFAAINIVGLSVSFAGALLICLYVSNELSFDRFHRNGDRIYRMYSAYADHGEAVEEFPDTPTNLGALLADNFEGVQAAARVISFNSYMMVRVGDVSFSEPFVFEADSSLFSIFSGEFVAGSRDALRKPHHAVLSRSTAERYFGSVDASIGREIVISLYGEGRYTVGGVVDDFPHNSHFRFNVLLSIDYASEKIHPDNWLATWPYTYVLLKEGVNPEDVRERLRQTVDRILDPIYLGRTGKTYSEEKKNGGLQEYGLQPLAKVHLYSAHMGEGGNILYVYIFIVIGVMLICIAAFNFINLSTARSAWEARNAGIRKALGASGGQLYRQSITESIMMNLIAAAIGVAIAQLLLVSGSEFLRSSSPTRRLDLD